jgi:hypothetical protein
VIAHRAYKLWNLCNPVILSDQYELCLVDCAPQNRESRSGKLPTRQGEFVSTCAQNLDKPILLGERHGAPNGGEEQADDSYV